MPLFLTLCLGLFIAIGALISQHGKDNHTIIQLSVALAFGTLLALAGVELVPEAMEHLEDNYAILGSAVFAGAVLLKLLDLVIPDHDHHFSEMGHEHAFTTRNVEHIGIVAAIAVSLHNLIEGMAVYSIASESLTTGFLVALGVGLHNIPMGMVIATTLSALSIPRKLRFLGMAMLSTFLGGLVMHFLWGMITEFVIGILLALTLGMVLYIVFIELLPMLLHLKNWPLTFGCTLVGVALIYVGHLLE